MAIIAVRDMPILKHFFPKNKTTSQRELSSYICEDGSNAYYKNYALNLCISRIARSLQLCDFQTFEDNSKVKGFNWYKLNIEPNQNQNQAQFIHSIIYKMVFCDDGALVLQTDEGSFIVAESYDLEKRAYQPNVYRNIVVAGGYQLKSIKYEHEVFHFVLDNNEIKKIVDSVYDDYAKLIQGTIRNYNRNNALKFKLKIDASFDAFKTRNVVDSEGNPITRDDGSIVTEYDDILDDFMINRFKGILSEDDSVTPFESGIDLDPITNQKGNTKSGAATTRDITDTFKDIIYMCSDAFGIPRAYILGDVADGEVVTNNYIDNAVRPIADNLETEINRKLYKFDGLKKGNKMKIKTNVITTKDPVKFANAAEAYLRTGIYTINNLLEMLGEEQLTDSFADTRFMTKNYQTMEEMEKAIVEAVNNAFRKK